MKKYSFRVNTCIVVTLSNFGTEVVDVSDLIKGAAPVGGDDVISGVLVHMVVKPDSGVDLISRQVEIGRGKKGSGKKPTKGIEH